MDTADRIRRSAAQSSPHTVGFLSEHVFLVFPILNTNIQDYKRFEMPESVPQLLYGPVLVIFHVKIIFGYLSTRVFGEALAARPGNQQQCGGAEEFTHLPGLFAGAASSVLVRLNYWAESAPRPPGPAAQSSSVFTTGPQLSSQHLPLNMAATQKDTDRHLEGIFPHPADRLECVAMVSR